MPATSSTRKPAKPYKEFRLFAHPNWDWQRKSKGSGGNSGSGKITKKPCKAISTKLMTFRLLGISAATVSAAVTVADMCNLLLPALDVKRGASEITTRHFQG